MVILSLALITRSSGPGSDQPAQSSASSNTYVHFKPDPVNASLTPSTDSSSRALNVSPTWMVQMWVHNKGLLIASQQGSPAP